jgi:tRNA-dihydrouridine synthase
MIEETGCDGVMIGRACQGNPWIFREAKRFLETGIMPEPPTLEERKSLMLRHLREMIKLLGETMGVREMRKHFSWYTKGLRNGAEFRTTVNELSRASEVKEELNLFFDALAHQ